MALIMSREHKNILKNKYCINTILLFYSRLDKFRYNFSVFLRIIPPKKSKRAQMKWEKCPQTTWLSGCFTILTTQLSLNRSPGNRRTYLKLSVQCKLNLLSSDHITVFHCAKDQLRWIFAHSNCARLIFAVRSSFFVDLLPLKPCFCSLLRTVLELIATWCCSSRILFIRSF